MLKNEQAPPASIQELKFKIAKRQITFPTTLERLARQMIERPEIVAFESAAAVARHFKVSQTTVHRLAHQMGFRTFRDFRAMIRENLRLVSSKID
ncbi:MULTISPECIES: MurR/RpiR family transcriptional regulator [Rhizobium]|uniref:DNA-binding MurR/RpiR family transcriptional regulator n=1 Tax=Rhizobium paranaense TaxID=1650438 RepID=A0A7W8XYH8_9HYPH|nr:MurR/RpiR family transcriptional regulator [Rhizobium paranaense]MBB5577934.1 DNA-binding MurR/RpiR family transcriptional regulator [Rhizobium paranaense]